MLNLTGNEVLTELSLNGVGVGSSDVPRVNRALLEGRAQSHCWTLLDSDCLETGRRPQKSGEEVVQTRTEDNPEFLAAALACAID